MEKKFKPGDRVYHRNLKLYGTFVDYAWTSDDECYVDFEVGDTYKDQKHVSVNWLILADEVSVKQNECAWRYFIILNKAEFPWNFLRDTIDGELLVCCDVKVAKSFFSPNELLRWIYENTELKAENGDFKIEGQYLPIDA